MFDLLKSLGALTGAELVGPVTTESAPGEEETQPPQSDQVGEARTEKDTEEETGAAKRLSQEAEGVIVNLLTTDDKYTFHAIFGCMLSVGAIHFEEWFCTSKKGGIGVVGGFKHRVLCI